MDYSDIDNLEELSDDEIARFAAHCANQFQSGYKDPLSIAKMSRNFTYLDGGQWDPAIANDRKLRGLMAVEYNMIRQYIRNMVAEFKQNDPSPVVIPTSDETPSMPVEKVTGLLHEIDYESNSKYVNGCAYHEEVVCGWGAIELCCERESTSSFAQVLRKKAVADIFECGWDLGAQNQCKTDGDWAYRDFSMSKRQIKRDFPDVDFNVLQNVTNQEVSASQGNADEILLRRFYARNYTTVQVVKLDDDEEMKKTDYEQMILQIEAKNLRNKQRFEQEVEKLKADGFPTKELPEFEPEAIPQVVKSFTDVDWDVWMFICTGNTCIKRTKLPIKKLPLVFIPGEMCIIENKEHPQPYAIDAFTPQKALNYYLSEMLDSVNRAIGTRWIANQESIMQWVDDYVRPKASNLMRYKNSTNGAAVQPPSIVSPPSCDPNLISLAQQSMESIQSILGKSTTAVQNQPEANSGKEYLYRMLSMNTVGGIYPDNLNMGMAEADKILLEWIPAVYDTERTIKIRNKQGQVEYVRINQTTGEDDENGELITHNDMSGIKDFTVEVYGGPSFAAQKLAGMEFLIDIMELNPQQYAPLMIDKVVEQSPFGFSNELVQRLIKGGAVNPIVLPKEEQPPQQGPSKEQELIEKEFKLKVAEKLADFMLKKEEIKQKILESKVKIVESMERLSSSKDKADAEKQKALLETMDVLVKTEAENITALAEISQASSVADNEVIETAGALVEEVITKQNEVLHGELQQF